MKLCRLVAVMVLVIIVVMTVEIMMVLVLTWYSTEHTCCICKVEGKSLGVSIGTVSRLKVAPKLSRLLYIFKTDCFRLHHVTVSHLSLKSFPEVELLYSFFVDIFNLLKYFIQLYLSKTAVCNNVHFAINLLMNIGVYEPSFYLLMNIGVYEA